MDALTVAVAVLLLQQVGVFYSAHFFGEAPESSAASLIHAHVGLMFAVALVARDRRVLATAFLATFAGWCVMVLRADAFEAGQALTIAVYLALLWRWTERCAGWIGAPFGARHGFGVADLARFAPIALLVFPLGWAALAVAISAVNGGAASALANEGVQLLLAKHVGVACLALPIMLLWTDGCAGQMHWRRLRALWALVGALLLASWLLQRVLAAGELVWLQQLYDYRLTAGAVLAALVLFVAPRWSMPALALVHFVMLHALVAAASRAEAVGEVGALLTHVLELNVMSLLLSGLYLANRDRRIATARIAQSARRDASTGLANATALHRDWARRKALPAQIGFLSFDHVDVLVGSYGWSTLRAMLRSVARVLASRVHAYHLGGAQFVLVPRNREGEGVDMDMDWTELLHHLQRHTFDAAGTRLRVTPYLGLATPQSLSVADLEGGVADAGEASTQARRRGETDPVQALDTDGNEGVDASARRRRFNAAVDVIDRVRAGHVELHLQRIVRIDGASDTGVSGEILCRLRNHDGSLLVPDRFIPALESSASVAELDLAVVEMLFAQLRKQPLLRQAARRLCINVSGVSLSADSFRARLTSLLADAPVAPSVLCFELTETAIIARHAQAARLIRELHALGCSLALDDFGSGMQNFSRLRQLPVEMIKIDGQFVRQAAQRRSDFEIVRAAVAVARAHGLETVAEHVEDAAADRCMRDLGVEWGQGYHYARPVPLAEVDLWVESQLLPANA
jgi:EAL domain-containing protein (putative c-di-GMP-specific phosphodiesterase class I)/GGDEF domain-containing protein